VIGNQQSGNDPRGIGINNVNVCESHLALLVRISYVTVACKFLLRRRQPYASDDLTMGCAELPDDEACPLQGRYPLLQTGSQNFQRRLSAASRLSVRPHSTRLPLDGIS